MSDNVFHDHLDVCAQCREHPFDLCQRGHDLLIEQATKSDRGVWDLLNDNVLLKDCEDAKKRNRKCPE